MQLVLCNYANLQLHVSHATENQLHVTVAKWKISSSDIKYEAFKESSSFVENNDLDVHISNIRVS